MLNKKIVAATTAALLVATAGVANAHSFGETKFNLGAEISVLNKTNYNSGNTNDLNNFKTNATDTKLAIKKSKPGANIFVGARFNKNVGLELGYGMIQKVKGTGIAGNQATNKVSNLYADVLGYMPVATKVNLIGSVGIGALKSKANVVNASFQDLGSLNKRKVSYRVGAGAQYDFCENWATRAMVRYQKGNKAFLKSNVSVAVGAVYTF